MSHPIPIIDIRKWVLVRNEKADRPIETESNVLISQNGAEIAKLADDKKKDKTVAQVKQDNSVEDTVGDT